MSLSTPSPNIAVDELAGTTLNDNDSIISNLRTSHAAISTILRSSIATARELEAIDGRLSCRREFLSGLAAAISPLQSQALATQALSRRINQAVSPAISFFQAFSRARRLERRLLALSSADSDQEGSEDHILLYVDCVGRLSEAVAEVTAECKPAVRRLQDAVEFLERTKATDKLRSKRLRNAAAALGTVCEEEVEQMRYGKLSRLDRYVGNDLIGYLKH